MNDRFDARLKNWRAKCDKYSKKCHWWNGWMFGFCISQICNVWCNITATVIVYGAFFFFAGYRLFQYSRTVDEEI